MPAFDEVLFDQGRSEAPRADKVCHAQQAVSRPRRGVGIQEIFNSANVLRRSDEALEQAAARRKRARATVGLLGGFSSHAGVVYARKVLSVLVATDSWLRRAA